MDRTELEKNLELVVEKPREAGPRLAGILGELDAAARAPGLPGELRHYLERRSYEKALGKLREMPAKEESS